MRVGFCRGCRFRLPIGALNECRRHAPAPSLVRTEADTERVQFANWPIVRLSDGCGEFVKGPHLDPTKET